jgi:hypothetical protein
VRGRLATLGDIWIIRRVNMEIQTKNNNNQKSYVQFLKLLVNAYLLVVLAIGLAYLIGAKTGNVGTIIAYIMNKDNLAAQAYIYTAFFEIFFIVFSMLGSTILLILFNLKYNKSNVVSVCILLATTLFYVISRVFLLTGTLQMVTRGDIKNTDFSDIKFIITQYHTAGQAVPITLTLLAGVVVLPFIIGKFNIHNNKLIDKNSNIA